MKFILTILSLVLVLPVSAQRRPAYVILNSAPLVEHLVRTAGKVHPRERMFTPESASYEAALRQEKAPLIANMQQRGIPVERQIETLLNAVFVQATEQDLAWLRTQPGVAAAEFSPTVYRHLDTATTLIGAPAAWNAL